jgi:hypothetical protein
MSSHKKIFSLNKMPWRIIKADGGYFVETISTKRRHSEKPMTKAKADAQLRILESKEKVIADGPISGYRGRKKN